MAFDSIGLTMNDSLYAARMVAELLGNWWLQSTVIITLGLIISHLLDRRGVAVQSAAYRATLVAVLLAPFAAAVSTSLGLAGYGYGLQIPVDWLKQPAVAKAEAADDIAPPATAKTPAVSVFDEAPLPSREEFHTATFPSDANATASDSYSVDDEPTRTNSAPPPEPVASRSSRSQGDSISQIAATQPATSDTWTSVGWLVVAAVIAWLSVSALFALRLLIAQLRMQQLIRRASPAGEDVERSCREVANRLGVTPPTVLVSPFLSSPCLSGVVRPKLLLASEDTASRTALHVILAHELAHLQRRDCLWQLLHRSCACLLWFQPLAWLLSRRLEQTAEEVCDDVAMHLGADRTRYANALVEIAELALPPATATAVNMISLRSPLGHRVKRILDRSRNLSTRAGAAVVAVVATAAICTTMLVGLLGAASTDATTQRADRQSQSKLQTTEEPPEEDVEGESTANLTELGQVTPQTPKPPLVRQIEKTSDKRQTNPKSEITNLESHVRGIVALDGKPVQDAPVVVIALPRIGYRGGDFSGEEPKVLATGMTDGVGVYRIELPELTAGRFRWAAVTTHVDGASIAFEHLNLDADEQEIELTVQPEAEPLEGRLVTLEGQPAAGVVVRLERVGTHQHGTFEGLKLPPDGDKVPFAITATSDENGNFTLAGVGGKEVSLRINDEPYARVWQLIKADASPEDRVIPLPPSQVAFGQVRGADTGEPIGHARFSLYTRRRPEFAGGEGMDGQADAQGRFRLNPLPAQAYDINVFPPDGVPYLAYTRHYVWPKGKLEHELNLELPRGTVVRGRITESGSDAPVAGATVKYEPQYVTEVERPENIITGWQSVVLSNDNGSYAIAVPPGPGYMFVEGPHLNYVRKMIGSRATNDGKEGGTRVYAHAIERVDPKPGDDAIQRDLQITVGKKIRGTIRNPDGSTPEKVLIMHAGQANLGESQFRIPRQWVHGGDFQVVGIDPAGETMPVYFLDPVNKLGAMVQVRGADELPLTVSLQPTGAAVVRLVDKDGKPIANEEFRYSLYMVVTPGPSPMLQFNRDNNDDDIPYYADEFILSNWDRENHWDLTTNDNGDVKLQGLIPGATYRIIGGGDKWQVLHEFTVQSGQTVRLATLQVGEDDSLTLAKAAPRGNGPKNEAEAEESQNTNDKSQTNFNSTPASADEIVVRGLVVAPQGNPVADADVFALGWHWESAKERGPLNHAKTDANGQFTISFRKSQFVESIGQPDQWRNTDIATFVDGYGPGWMTYRNITKDKPVVLRLAQDVPIEGRIIDLEGRPIDQARIELKSIARSDGGDLSEYVDALQSGQHLFTADDHLTTSVSVTTAPLRKEVTSDADGRFRLHGIGHQRQALLQVSGPTIVTQEIRVLSQPLEPITVEAGWPGFSFPKTIYGTPFSHAAPPTQVIEGTVRDAETGQPLADVRIMSSKFAGTKLAGVHTVQTTTDPDGEFQLIGMPKGAGNTIVVVPNDQQPYFPRQIEVPAAGGLATVAVDVELHQGIWITGRVENEKTGEPIVGRIYYMPFGENERAQKLPEFDEDDAGLDHYQSYADGRYRIVGLPGPAIVGVWSIRDPYPRGQGYEEIFGDDEQDRTLGFGGPNPNWPTAMKKINPPKDAEQFECNLQIDPGQRVKIKVVDPEGRAIEGVQVTGLRPLGFSAPTHESTFEAVAFAPGETRRMLFFHEERNLGHAPLIDIDDVSGKELVIKLQPNATITGRLIDEHGEPVVDARLRFDLNDGDYSKNLQSVATDENGRFKHTAVLPGGDYSILASSVEFGYHNLARDLAPKPGQTVDLGDVTIKPEN